MKKILSGLLGLTLLVAGPIQSAASGSGNPADVVGDQAAKLAIAAAQAFARALRENKEAVRQAIKDNKDLFATFGETMGETLPAMAPGFSKLFEGIGTGVGEGLANVGPGIAKFSASTASTFDTTATKFGDTFRRELIKAMEGMGTGYAKVIAPIRNELIIGTLGFGAVTTLAYLAKIAGEKYIKRFFYEPSLIEKQSSALSLSWFTKPAKISDYMVISDALDKQLNYIISTTKNVKKHGGTYDNILEYGEPGTGKTLYGKLLAQNSGMKFAFVPGANVSQFLANGTAVEELNNLFNWAEKTGGAILFFDEAEIFLGDRSKLSAAAQNALSAFLVRTGTPSSKFMVIAATNRPSALDKAVLSRFGVKVEFPLPDKNARKKQLEMHIRDVFTKQRGTKVAYDYLTNNIDDIANRSEGFSGRTLQQFVNRLRQMALAQGILAVNKAMVDEAIAQIRKDNERFSAIMPVEDGVSGKSKPTVPASNSFRPTSVRDIPADTAAEA